MQIILLFSFVFLSVWIVYLAIYSIAGLFYKSPQNLKPSKNKYLVLIPAYKEDNTIIRSLKANLSQEIDRSMVEFMVIADHLKKETILKIKELNVGLVEVSFKKSTKAKSINYALNFIDTSVYSHVLILDSDNEMKPGFFSVIDSFMGDQVEAIQAHRAAKNTESSTAWLDAINEEIGNHIFRKGHQVLGLSAALIGSGMVFKLEIYKELMSEINDTAGEDKMLEFALLNEKIKVKYVNEAIVYDEKVSSVNQFDSQRTRWVTARFYFLKHYALTALRKLTKGDFDYFNKWLQFLLPQKILLIGYTAIFWVTCQIMGYYLWLSSGLLILLTFTFAIAIPRKYFSRQLLRALFHAPKIMIRMILVVLKAPFSDPGKFVVTAKGHS